MSYRKLEHTEYPSEGVIMHKVIHVEDGEQLDTECILSGLFVVAGCNHKEFTEKLGSLIDEYRI